MELARGSADYLLLVDADQTLERPGPLRPLTSDAYLLRHAGALSYAVPRLVRGDRRWWYEGSTHEYLATEGEFSQEEMGELIVHHHGDSGTRGEKLERDIRLLERDLELRPDDDRATFYLAQTYRDAGRDGARRSSSTAAAWSLGGGTRRSSTRPIRRGCCTGHGDPEAAVPLLTDAYERRPTRAEPLQELARLSRLEGDYEAAYEFAERGAALEIPEDILFVHRDAYEWGLDFELAVAAYWTGRHAEALDLFDRLIDGGRLPGAVERGGPREHRLLPHRARRRGAPTAAPDRGARIAHSKPRARGASASRRARLAGVQPLDRRGRRRLPDDRPDRQLSPRAAGATRCSTTRGLHPDVQLPRSPRP